jgi:membrane-associated phospholipid phosphatase
VGLTRPSAVFGAVPLVGVAFLLDDPVQRWAVQIQHAVADTVVGILNPIGSGVTLLIVSIGLAVLCRLLGRGRVCAAAWLSALAFTAAGLAEYALKHVVGRPRPVAGVTPGVVELDSFPSGHATSVFAVATVLGAFYPWLRWPLYTIAGAVAVGRVYLARHYLSDIVAGAVIGLVVASRLLRHRHAIAARTVRSA